MKLPVELLATWFYLGRLKPAPGSMGTLGAIPLIILLRFLGAIPYLLAVTFLVTLAMILAQLYEQYHEGHDHPEIVIDEVAGFAVAMSWIPETWQAWVIGFGLFRLIDILKPPPIGWIDAQVRGGVGVVADDVVAGIVVNIILQVLFVQTSWLGYQWPS